MSRLFDRASRRDFNGGIIEKSGHFLTALVIEGQFFALQMVNFSSLHDEGRPAEVFYHHRRDTLVIALQMDILPLILGVIFMKWAVPQNCAADSFSLCRSDL